MSQPKLKASLSAKGPHAFTAAEEGSRYSWGDAEIVIKISPDSTKFTYVSAWQVNLQEEGQADFMAVKSVDRLYCCQEGSGVVQLDSEEYEIKQGSFVHCGRGVSLQFKNKGKGQLRVMGYSTPAAPEAKESMLNPELDLPNLSKSARSLIGFLDAEEAAVMPEELKGEAYVRGPDDGDSFWQPEPSNGYVTTKTPVEVALFSNYGSAQQLLEPGASIVEHAHKRAVEMLISIRGSGKIAVHGEEEIDFMPGAVAVVGPTTQHTFRNAGDDDFVVCAFTTSTETGEALLELGVERKLGEARPTEIVRDAETLMNMIDKHGFMIRGINA